MGKITLVSKSRKEFKCSKCGQTIPVGTAYYRGSLNFHPDIIRCWSCGLKSYEVTTSDYLRNVGSIIHEYRQDFEYGESIASDIIEQLQEILDETQERFDNMPEQLQEADTGQILQERIDGLESAIAELEYIDYEEIVKEQIEELISYDEDEAPEYDSLSDDEKQEVDESVMEEIYQMIDNALSNVVE